ncbi:MAG TPA: thrombospondin type 3 repeat-containing protein [Fimbriimonadaceae bacterium]|nr:thrombospondin type 3 repeat-containing protein [Fimbriimonadaceae bacterium]
MKRFLTIGLVLALSVLALASASFLKVFNTTYNVKADSELGKAKCGACHTGKMGGKLNKYGMDLDEAMKEAKSKTITAEILAKIHELDSDGDGMKNGEELKAGRNPGAK